MKKAMVTPMTYNDALSLCHSMIYYFEGKSGLNANRIVIGKELYLKLYYQTKMTVRFNVETGDGTHYETLFGIPITIDYGQGRERVFEVYHADTIDVDIEDAETYTIAEAAKKALIAELKKMQKE